MNEVKDGVVMPDDENLIIVPTGFSEPLIPKEHFVQQGENIKTCNMTVERPQDHIGEEVTCPECGKKFKIVRQEDAVKEAQEKEKK